MTKFYVYLHCTPDGAPFYVGKGSGKRAKQLRTGRNAEHRLIVDAHGSRNITVRLFYCESEDDAIAKEASWIAQLRADGVKLTNKSTGGQCGATGCIRSPETLLKMSLSQRGRTFSAETIQRMRDARRPGNTPDACARQARAIRGNKFALGSKHSQELKLEFSKRFGGERNPQASITEETVRAIRVDYENPETSWRDLSVRYGVSRTQVGRIVNRKSWAVVS